jgi:hypothetical protein
LPGFLSSSRQMLKQHYKIDSDSFLPHPSQSLCWTKHHSMKTDWGSGGIAPRILDLGTRWRWVVNFTPRSLYPRERIPANHWIGVWVGPRDVLDAVVKR